HPGRVRQDIGVHVRLRYENRVLRSALHGGIDGVDQLIVGHTVSGVLDPVMLPLRSGGAALYRLVQLPFGVLADAGVAGPPPGGGGTLSTCSNVAQNHVGVWWASTAECEVRLIRTAPGPGRWSHPVQK